MQDLIVGRSLWGVTPRQSIEAACSAHGSSVVVQACIDLLAGDADVDPLLVRVLGGPRAEAFLSRPTQAYWLRVWAARGLLWVWEDRAWPSLASALDDEAWRVREMAAKVVARHLLGQALPQIATLAHDPVPRVRQAASRALTRLTSTRA